MTEQDTTGQPGPYATAAPAYWRLGWSPLPLPAGQKTPVPKGYTGATGTAASFPDVQAWTETHGAGNLALRLPPDILGVDVDQYDGKPGGLVLQALEAKLGNLPATWRTTSRDDGMSGIRLYRIPVGLRWPGTLGPGIDTIRHDHRYAVAWPSIHPNGGTYRWITPGGATTITDLPDPTLLPDLPDAWVEHFTGGEVASDQARADLTDPTARQWVATNGTGTPCRVMAGVLERALTDLRTTTTRHDTALQATNRIVWIAGEGHTGATLALHDARAAFLAATGHDRGDGEADAEWDRMVTGAARLSAAAHPAPRPDPCTDPFHGLLKDTTWTPSTASPQPSNTSSSSSNATASTSSPSAPSATTASSTPATTETSTPTGGPATPDPAGDASREVLSRLKLGGEFILDIPDNIPSIWGSGDHVLWASGEALTLCGPAGVGKTTLCGQVVRARLVGGSVLGLPVQPAASRVLYLAMDRPRQIARALRRTLGDLPREILDEKLIVWPGPPVADVAAHPSTLLALVELARADTVIVDSIKDAAVGLSSDEVGAGYNRARQMCIAAGIEVLEQHHMVKKGDNGSAPTSLSDLYGSVWIGAGSGSVVLLHGAAGDPIVSMTHLKTPADEVGPWRLRHDHAAGITDIFHSTDIVAMAKAAGSSGLTAKAVACSITEKENPNQAAVEKARRQLDRLVDSGHLTRSGSSAGGGHKGASAVVWWFVTDDPIGALTGSQSTHGSTHAPSSTEEGHGGSRALTNTPESSTKSTHESTHGTHAAEHSRSSPPLEGGRVVQDPSATPTKTPSKIPRIVERVIGGERVNFNLDTGEVVS